MHVSSLRLGMFYWLTANLFHVTVVFSSSLSSNHYHTLHHFHHHHHYYYIITIIHFIIFTTIMITITLVLSALSLHFHWSTNICNLKYTKTKQTKNRKIYWLVYGELSAINPLIFSLLNNVTQTNPGSLTSWSKCCPQKDAYRTLCGIVTTGTNTAHKARTLVPL